MHLLLHDLKFLVASWPAQLFSTFHRVFARASDYGEDSSKAPLVFGGRTRGTLRQVFVVSPEEYFESFDPT